MCAYVCSQLVDLFVVGSYFGQYLDLGPSGNKDPRPLKSSILFVWWTGLGSL